MKQKFYIQFIIICILLFTVSMLWAQSIPYNGPEDPAGDIGAEREGYMNGNRVFLYFKNNTELSDWPKVDVSKWPNSFDGVKMVDGIGLLVGAQVFIKNDTIPVTDLNEVAQLDAVGQLDTLHFLQTSFREEMDTDPTGTIEWGFYPVFGYFNEASEYPAMSNKPSSWPIGGWPSKGFEKKWPGEWDGRFGRGKTYAQLETYFVVNDAQDQEYLGPEDKVRYAPRPGKYIGDLLPNVTIQKGAPWGGLGIRVEQRGFQWNNPQAQDAIFWEYTIANISDYDLPKVAFGYWVDNAIGDAIAGAGDDDEFGYFNTYIDLAYSWDMDGIGQGGFPTGTMGFAYLESPGLGFDNIDNDEDGLLDERRDNDALVKVGPTDGIYDLNAFLEFYKLEESDLKEHWDADEDQDWQDGFDANGDGIYQVSEFAGDDVGTDGVGPSDINYNGPDTDGSECNHKPDRTESGDSEPNFAETDVSESDMVGLTAFRLFPVQPHRPPYTGWFRNDKSMWEIIGVDTLIENIEWTSNLIETFASGPFPLYKGRTERISMSELHSYDPLEGLNSESHTAPALFEQKRIVQVIYEKDYRFAQPPRMPTLMATPGDGFVVLSWDDVSDTQTKDPFIGNVNDFEGYKLYRSTDKKLQDAEVITDGFGNPFLKRPIFQCDLNDGKNGFTDFGLVNGVGYNLGFDTGITHYFKDENVQNGRTYYYALVAYDYGIKDLGPGISPSENNIVIELDESEQISSYGQNVQIVVPRTHAAGYNAPGVKGEEQSLLGTGIIEPEILATNSLKPDHTYKVTFSIDTVFNIEDYEYGILYTTNGYSIYDVTEGDRLVYQESPEKYAYNNLSYKDTTQYTEWENYWYLKNDDQIVTDIFDGLRLKIHHDIELPEMDVANTGWLTGNAPIEVIPTQREALYFPWDFDIIFTNQDSVYTGRATTKLMRDENHKRLRSSAVLLNQSFNFYVVNNAVTDSVGNPELLDMAVHDVNTNGTFEILEDRVLVGPLTTEGKWAGTVFVLDFSKIQSDSDLPKNNDVYRVKYNRSFWINDSYTFKVDALVGLDEGQLKSSMDDIKVVPNPYVATNSMEPSVSNWLLNQRRRLMFTHLPARCTIKIFTISGVLVDIIEVENSEDNGIAHWDLLSHEELDVAAGMYLFHVKATETGDEKMGKFAIIK